MIKKLNLVIIIDEDARENAKKTNELIDQRESDKKNRDKQIHELMMEIAKLKAKLEKK